MVTTLDDDSDAGGGGCAAQPSASLTSLASLPCGSGSGARTRVSSTSNAHVSSYTSWPTFRYRQCRQAAHIDRPNAPPDATNSGGGIAGGENGRQGSLVRTKGQAREEPRGPPPSVAWRHGGRGAPCRQTVVQQKRSVPLKHRRLFRYRTWQRAATRPTRAASRSCIAGYGGSYGKSAAVGWVCDLNGHRADWEALASDLFARTSIASRKASWPQKCGSAAPTDWGSKAKNNKFTRNGLSLIIT